MERRKTQLKVGGKHKGEGKVVKKWGTEEAMGGRKGGFNVLLFSPYHVPF